MCRFKDRYKLLSLEDKNGADRADKEHETSKASIKKRELAKSNPFAMTVESFTIYHLVILISI